MMRLAVSACFALVFAALAPANARAQATTMSIDHLVVDRMVLDTCMKWGDTALRQAGLKVAAPSSAAVWGVSPDGANTATVYCVETRGVIVVVVSGTSIEKTRPTLDRLLDRLKQQK